MRGSLQYKFLAGRERLSEGGKLHCIHSVDIGGGRCLHRLNLQVGALLSD